MVIRLAESLDLPLRERNALLLQMRQLEEGARARVAYLVQTYDAMAQGVREQAAEVQGTLKSLSEQVAAGVAM